MAEVCGPGSRDFSQEVTSVGAGRGPRCAASETATGKSPEKARLFLRAVPAPRALLARCCLRGIFGVRVERFFPTAGHALQSVPGQASAPVAVLRKASGRSRGPRRPEFPKTGRADSALLPRPVGADGLASSSWRPGSLGAGLRWPGRLEGSCLPLGVRTPCLGRLVRCSRQFRVLFAVFVDLRVSAKS